MVRFVTQSLQDCYKRMTLWLRCYHNRVNHSWQVGFLYSKVKIMEATELGL
jgi:hypothetical protein